MLTITVIFPTYRLSEAMPHRHTMKYTWSLGKRVSIDTAVSTCVDGSMSVVFLKDLTYDYVRMNECLNPRDVCLSITKANSEYTTSIWLCDKIKCPLPRVGSHTFLNVLKYVLLVWITGNSFITCSIPTSHDFRVISARTWVRASTKRKRFISN